MTLRERLRALRGKWLTPRQWLIYRLTKRVLEVEHELRELRKQLHDTVVTNEKRLNEARSKLAGIDYTIWQAIENARYYVDWQTLHDWNRLQYDERMRLALTKRERHFARDSYEAVEAFLFYVRDRYRSAAEKRDAQDSVYSAVKETFIKKLTI